MSPGPSDPNLGNAEEFWMRSRAWPQHLQSAAASCGWGPADLVAPPELFGPVVTGRPLRRATAPSAASFCSVFTSKLIVDDEAK